MSGIKPDDPAQLMRDFERRLRALERPTISRVGRWTFEEGPNESLIVTHSGTGRVVTLYAPPTTDPSA